jgi:hypothetical protein
MEMKNMRVTAFALVAVLAVYAGRAAAQHSHDHSADSTNQDQTKSGTTSPGMMGQGMTGGGMMGIEQMHTQMTQQGGMMKEMSGMMMKNCPIMGDNKPSTQ